MPKVAICMKRFKLFSGQRILEKRSQKRETRRAEYDRKLIKPNPPPPHPPNSLGCFLFDAHERSGILICQLVYNDYIISL